MDTNEWKSIQENRQVLIDNVDVREMVFYLTELINDPPTIRDYYFSPIEVDAETTEIKEFEEHVNIENLLEYLRRRKHGFLFLCEALRSSKQDFLADQLVKDKNSLPPDDREVSYYIPESRRPVLDKIVDSLQNSRHHINLYGEQGVGTSHFLRTVRCRLEQDFYFTVRNIDLAEMPLILQHRYFDQVRRELVLKEAAMKRYCILCLDNTNSSLLDERQKQKEYQMKFLERIIEVCVEQKVSVLMTSSTRHPKMENVQLSRLSVAEMCRDISSQFGLLSDSYDMEDLCGVFPEFCNPLDCYLMTTYYLQHHRKVQYLSSFIAKSRDLRNDLFEAIFKNLDKIQQDVLFSLYSLPCNAKITLSSIHCLINSTSRLPDEDETRNLESIVQELLDLNLLQFKDEWYFMKDSNFYYHFRSFFNRLYFKRFRRFYLFGLHHYLDYAIRVIRAVESLNELTPVQQNEWKEIIPRLTIVLDPHERSLEDGLLRKPKLCEPVYIKRFFVLEKLRNIFLHIPQEVLVLGAENLLRDFESHHVKYAQLEDKVKLLCLIAELSMTPNCRMVDSRNQIYRALKEVRQLLDRFEAGRATDLRKKYYMRLLYPLGEVYKQEGNFEEAIRCFKECRKLQLNNKSINWMLHKKIRNIQDLMDDTKTSPMEAEVLSPLSDPTKMMKKDDLFREMQHHIGMGDSYYQRGEYVYAFNYFFELYRKFYNPNLYIKEQEYITMMLGHLKLQKQLILTKSNVRSATKFYEESNNFYRLRKSHDSEFLKVCLFVSNVVANNKRAAKSKAIELKKLQETWQSEFFLVIVRRDSNHGSLWKDLTKSEKQQQVNRLKTSVVNYYMVEECPIKHYSTRKDEFLTDDYEKFLEFPSANIYKMIDKFNPAQLYRDENAHLAVYIKMRSTRI